MYVNSSLTAQRIQKFVLVLGSFGLETALTREKISVWESLFSLKFRWIPKDADLCLSLKSFRWESWNSIRVTTPSVENCVLLKCRKLRREDQETSDSIVGFFIEKKPSVMVGCSHRNLILSHFYRVSYRQNWRRDFLELKHQRKHTSEGNKPNESTSGQDKVICRSKVESLSSLTHWS